MPFGEKLLEIPVGQPVPQVPTHRQQDHLGRETEASEPRGHLPRRPRTASALHRSSLTGTVPSVNATEPFKGPDRLREEILARLAAHPVRYTLEVQVAGPKDDPHDPTSLWKAEFFDAGTIEVIGPDPEREQNGEIVVFDPTRVVGGIELSDDPVLRYRSAAYSVSVGRRV
jgi:hypothetical protein